MQLTRRSVTVICHRPHTSRWFPVKSIVRGTQCAGGHIWLLHRCNSQICPPAHWVPLTIDFTGNQREVCGRWQITVTLLRVNCIEPGQTERRIAPAFTPVCRAKSPERLEDGFCITDYYYNYYLQLLTIFHSNFPVWNRIYLFTYLKNITILIVTWLLFLYLYFI